MTFARRWALLAGLLAVSVPLVSPVGSAAAPEDTSWSPATVEGPPRGAGFLEAGYVVYATGDAGTGVSSDQTACSIDGGDADLFLMTFPGGPGCVDAIDASGGEIDSEGVDALATAAQRNRTVVALPGGGGLGGPNPRLVAFDVVDGNFSSAWSTNTPGPVLGLATDTDGRRVVATVQEGSSQADATYQLRVHGVGGDRTASFQLPGRPHALALSPSGQWAAVGGNFTEGNATFGWFELYRVGPNPGEDPVASEEIRRARTGVVRSVAVTDQGLILAGTDGGSALALAPEGTLQDHKVGNGTAEVTASRNGTLVVAAAGSTVARLGGLPDGLEAIWQATVDGTATGVRARSPYVYVLAGDVSGFSETGHRLWDHDGGDRFAINANGRAFAVGARGAVGATGAQTSTLTAAQALPALNVSQPRPIPEVSPGDVAVVNLTLTNPGSAILNLTVDPDEPEGLTVGSLPDRFQLRPGTNRTVSLTVAAGPSASPGETEIPLSFKERPRADTNASLQVRVGESSAVDLRLEPGSVRKRAVVQDQNLTLRYVLQNDGNAEASIRLGVAQALSRGDLWPTEISPAREFTLSPDARTTVEVDIHVPETARDGTTNRLVLRAHAGGASSAVPVDLVVNPFEALNIEPLTLTKKLAPGGTTPFNFTVSNLGSVPVNASLTARAIADDGEPYVPADWGLVLDRSDLSLGAETDRQVTLEVTGPENGTEGQSLRVQVLASTGEGARDSSIAFAVLDPSLAKTPEEPKREPLAVWIPLAALAAGAVATRRSKHDKV